MAWVADGASMSRAKPAAKGKAKPSRYVAGNPLSQHLNPSSDTGGAAPRKTTVNSSDAVSGSAMSQQSSQPKATPKPDKGTTTVNSNDVVAGNPMSPHLNATTMRSVNNAQNQAAYENAHEKASQAADEFSYYDADGTVAESGDNSNVHDINAAMQEALDSGAVFSDVNLDEVEGWDPEMFNYEMVFHGGADVNPFGIVYGYDTMYEPLVDENGKYVLDADGNVQYEAYYVLSDEANKAREEYLYSLYTDPSLAYEFGDYAGMSREDFAKMYADAQSFVENLENMTDTGYSMFYGDDEVLEAIATLALANNIGFETGDSRYNVLDLFVNEDNTYDEELAIKGIKQYLGDQMMRSATKDLWDENNNLSAEDNEIAKARLGWRQGDLNSVGEIENLYYLAGTAPNANTTAHRGNWTLNDDIAGEEWFKKATGKRWGNKKYYDGDVTPPVENFSDNVFAIYTGMGYTG